MKLSEEHVQFFSVQALLSNLPLRRVRNNLDGIYDDSTRVLLGLDGTGLSARCFDRLTTIRKDHVNNSELMGLLLAPLLTYHHDLLRKMQTPGEPVAPEPAQEPLLRQSSLTQFPDINRPAHVPRNLTRLGKFIVKFRVRFPVFRRYFAAQGVGASLSVRPTPVDGEQATQRLLFENDFANDAFFMSLFYFVALFSKSDPEFDENFFQDFLFEFFIKNR